MEQIDSRMKAQCAWLFHRHASRRVSPTRRTYCPLSVPLSSPLCPRLLIPLLSRLQ